MQSSYRGITKEKAPVHLTKELPQTIEFLELASLPEFSRTFAKSMSFREESK